MQRLGVGGGALLKEKKDVTRYDTSVHGSRGRGTLGGVTVRIVVLASSEQKIGNSLSAGLCRGCVQRRLANDDGGEEDSQMYDRRTIGANGQGHERHANNTVQSTQRRVFESKVKSN